MRFMILRKADPDTEAGVMASEELIADMAAYIEEMVEAGVMIQGDGLQPSAKGARVSFGGGTPTVTDGPFTEAKELIAGITIIDVASKDEAVAWARRWPVSDGAGNVQLEIRRMYELSELGEGAGIERHARLRERLATR